MKAQDPALAVLAAVLPTLQDAGMRCRLESALIAPPAEMPAALPDRVLSPKETALTFSVTTKTVFKMAREGALHSVKLPGRVRGVGFLASEVGALLTRCAGGEAV
ncbi:MAG: hypothetical protein NTY53_18620 [Kiritimatiellaeota bacterium]|nr:hypothetical protein [Kiritimatiellota bacterium]